MTTFKKPSQIVVLTALFFFAGILESQVPKKSAPAHSSTVGELKVTFLDCGQGDAAVIKTPSGKVYLIDTGPTEREHGGEFEAGTDVIIPFLRSENIRKIDGIVLTHPHLDHIGGTLSIMNTFQVTEVFDPGWEYSSTFYQRILETIQRKKIKFTVVKEDMKLSWDPHLKVEAYGPRDEIYADVPEKENTNNRSIVLKITYKKVSFFLSGDAELEAEDHMVSRYGGELESTILKAPHHGSRTSSINSFLEAVNPEVIVISCGRRNRFKHPHPTVLARFESMGFKYYRTDTDGTIQVTTDGNRYKVKVFGVGNTPGKTYRRY